MQQKGNGGDVLATDVRHRIELIRPREHEDHLAGTLADYHLEEEDDTST